MMRLRTRFLRLALPALLLSSCVTVYSSFTNLTPRQQPRNDTGSYPVEISWDSQQQALRPQSVHAKVQVGDKYYDMKRVPQLPNRWETLIPVPPGTNFVNYRIRVEFQYNSIPVPRDDSRVSPLYQLEVVEPRPAIEIKPEPAK